MATYPVLIDVSRLVWRQWTGRLPTGIDRVCLAYLAHFGPAARAVVQFKQFRRIFDQRGSERLFDILLRGDPAFRQRFVRFLAVDGLRSEAAARGQIYLNVGHTGLNSSCLERWVQARQLRPVYLIHDLIPILHPHLCRLGEDQRHTKRVETALRSASGLIANSQATRDELHAFAAARNLPVPPDVVARLGTERVASGDASGPSPAEHPYFVTVGTVEARKNHILLLRAWATLVGQLGDAAPRLVIVGQRGWEAQDAIAILDRPGKLGEYIRELGRCGDPAMRALLAGARAMLLPSLAEGYGLPLVEALEQRVPVIASDLAVFRELAGDVPAYLDPINLEAWVETIQSYCGDSADRQRQLSAIAEFSAPSWSDHFNRVDAFIASLECEAFNPTRAG